MKKGLGTALCLGIIFCVTFYFYTRPTVSVVMSTYNRADRVGQTIQSVLNQTYPDFEFIIINDSSPDTTADVLEYYAKKDNRIRVLTNDKNLGLIGSLNKGLDAARGKYIARIDDDDKMFLTRLEKQVAHMESHPDTTVLATGIRTIRRGQKESDLGCPAPSAQVLVNMHFANGIAHSSTMLRRSFLDKNRIRYNAAYPAAEDYKLWQDIFLAGGSIDCLQEQLTEYTVGGGHSGDFYKNQSHSSKQIRLIYLNRFFLADEDTFKENPCLTFKKMVEANRTKHLVDEKLLQAKHTEYCKDTENSYYIWHPHWADIFVFNSATRVHRSADPSQTATLISNKDNILTIKWDKWGTERFLCDAHKSCRFLK